MSLRKLFSCVSQQNTRRDQQERDNDAYAEGRVGCGTIQTSKVRRRSRERCPKCKGVLPPSRDKTGSRPQQLLLQSHAAVPPILIPAAKCVKEDSGCFEARQLHAEPEAARPAQGDQEDSGVGLGDTADCPGPSTQPRRQQQQQHQQPAPFKSGADSRSTDLFLLQLREQTRWVPRLPNQQAPCDRASQNRFRELKAACTMQVRLQPLAASK